MQNNNEQLYTDAQRIYTGAIEESLPNYAVKTTLEKICFSSGRIVLIAIGKAAWEMANTASQILGNRICNGVVVTKYDHSRGPIAGLRIIEAGHPIPDENSVYGTKLALQAVSGMTDRDTVLFLVSGGGSALFEYPHLTLEELQDINAQLLAAGADIRQINTIRKRLSMVKGGRFAPACAPANIVVLVLSDVIDDQLDMIASGPVCADSSTCVQALEIAHRYHLQMSQTAWTLLGKETPKILPNVRHYICGSVSGLCASAEKICRSLGYETTVLTTHLNCEARQAGTFLGNIARTHSGKGKKLAFIAGGETVVHLKGAGKGGRNQELALAAAEEISGLENVTVFSVGSDGTDGPTNAAGGIVNGCTQQFLLEQGISIRDVLERNDAYHALECCGGLIITGATGTNVNDLSVVLVNS